MVSGGDETPCCPVSGKWKVPPMVVPNVQLAVLENCVPGEFGGTALLSTTVTLSTICCPAGIAGKPLKDRKSTRLNSSHANISYAVFCLKKKNDKAPLTA